MDDSNRDNIEQFMAAMERGDSESAAAFVHDDVVMEWPQSGERFRGKRNALAGISATEVQPEVAGEPRLVGSGNVWVAMMPLRYGDEISHYVGVYELEDGKVRRTTEFWGAPFPASEARAAFADRD